ncbi:hypothetical protein BgiBS90_022884 [Biomphalaria glabrata]|nr:hypothetical protein BgiBS90_022884 [Biomphalaria glabrata]
MLTSRALPSIALRHPCIKFREAICLPRTSDPREGQWPFETNDWGLSTSVQSRHPPWACTVRGGWGTGGGDMLEEGGGEQEREEI